MTEWFHALQFSPPLLVFGYFSAHGPWALQLDASSPCLPFLASKDVEANSEVDRGSAILMVSQGNSSHKVGKKFRFDMKDYSLKYFYHGLDFFPFDFY